MKKQLRLISASALCFLTLMALVLTSCEKQEQNFGPTTFYKPCVNVICLNGGACQDGRCVCPAGFEGAQCEVKSVEKFIGSYAGFDECFMSGQESYTSSITADFEPVNALTLRGVSTVCSNELKAFVTANKTNFNIPFQKSCQNYWVSGEGNIYNNVLNINIVLRDTVLHTSTTCSILLNKQ